jgi:hypothetical protein
MIGDNSLRRQESYSPRRFVRLARADDLGRLAKKWWRRPELTIRRPQHATEFVFLLPNPPWALKAANDRALRARLIRSPDEEDVYRALVGQPNGIWTQALEKAYANATVGKKPICQQFDTLLYKVFVKALGTVVAKSATELGDDYIQVVEKEIRNLPPEARRTPGPHLSANDRAERARRRHSNARRLYIRYNLVMAQVQELRRFLARRKDKGVTDDAALLKEASQQFTYDWMLHIASGEAFQHIVDFKTGLEHHSSLASLAWSPRALTLGIMVCEEKGADGRARQGPKGLYRLVLDGAPR